MARTMKAGVVHAFGKPLTIEEVPIPTPGPGEVLINRHSSAGTFRPVKMISSAARQASNRELALS